MPSKLHTPHTDGWFSFGDARMYVTREILRCSRHSATVGRSSSDRAFFFFREAREIGHQRRDIIGTISWIKRKDTQTSAAEPTAAAICNLWGVSLFSGTLLTDFSRRQSMLPTLCYYNSDHGREERRVRGLPRMHRYSRGFFWAKDLPPLNTQISSLSWRVMHSLT